MKAVSESDTKIVGANVMGGKPEREVEIVVDIITDGKLLIE